MDGSRGAFPAEARGRVQDVLRRAHAARAACGPEAPTPLGGPLGRRLERLCGRREPVAVVAVRVEGLATVAERRGAATAARLRAVALERARGESPEPDLVTPLEDDTFATAVAPGEAAAVAQRWADAFTVPLGAGLSLPARVGVAVADGLASRPGELLARVGLAVAAAPSGRTYATYDADRAERDLERYARTAALSRAIDDGTLSLRYQPLVALQSGDLVGLESLLRWDDPGLGPVPPSAFIPLAEATDLILPIGTWVLRRALGTLAGWRATVPALPPLGMSVNVSARQLLRSGFVDTLEAVLADTGVDPGLVLLELTETAQLCEDAGARDGMARVRDLGVRVALDDFGTGWASLDYLRRLPVDVVKIAQVFVAQIGTSRPADGLVRAIIDLANSLGLITVAEGVEEAHQATELRRMGCFLGQGWHFGRELTEAQATALVRATAGTAAGVP